jgi:serine/threonine protein kinase/tetratricopeptide (TPR) repeat protein
MPDAPEGAKSARGFLSSGTTVGRFVLGERLGAGGMGQVYIAQDTLLTRKVAIKRMAPELQFDAQDRARFLKEAQRASILNTPNIAAIYDVLEDKGEVLVVMEYIEGITLRKRCERPVSIQEFVSIAKQCAEGLEAAHAERIVHCDIKPENIMLTPTNRVKILDFGVAKHFATTTADQATQSLVTMKGGALSGTPAYMAPEVLTQKLYDGRADLFSLGLVFYEMLGGKQPFVADSFVGTLGRVLHLEVPSLKDVNKDVPAPIVQIVSRLLEKDPDNRYPNATALLADLRTVELGGTISNVPKPSSGVAKLKQKRSRSRELIVALVVLAATAALAILYRVEPTAFHFSKSPATSEPATLPPTQILAVLPFKAIGGDPKLTALGEGLVQSVGAKLSQLSQGRSLEVISARNLEEKHIISLANAKSQFGANLGVSIGLEPAGDLIHASYTLVDAASGRTLVGETITVPNGDVFSIEDDIAQGAVRALHLSLRSEEQTALKVHGTTQPTAYEYYLRARGYLLDYEQKENVDNAIVMAKQALKLDPAFGMAKAALGESYWRKYALSKDKKWTALATAECDAAVKLGNAGESGHSCLGVVDDGTGQYRSASDEYRHAAELEPSSESAALGLALALEHQGSLDDAAKAFQRAIDTHPQSYFAYNAVGGFYYRRGDLAKAAQMFDKVTHLAPENYVGYVNLAGTYNEMGRYGDSIAPLKKSIALRPNYAAYANLGTAYFCMRNFSDAATAYEEAAKLDPNQYVIFGNLAAALFYGGKKSEGLLQYKKALEMASEQIKVNPHDADTLSDICEYYAMLGDREHALLYLQRALQYGHGERGLLLSAAQVYNELGETGLALEWLTKAVHAGYPAAKLRDYPTFDPLKDNPVFQSLLAPS